MDRQDGEQTFPSQFGRGWIPAARDIGLPDEGAVGDSSSKPPHNGWTVPRRLAFLEHLAQRGHVRAACAAVGLSAEAAYKLRRREPLFAAAWDAALVLARRVAEQVLATRAIDGIEEPVWFRGELVGLRVRHDTRLLLAHLARLDRHAESTPYAGHRAERFDELLACVAGATFPKGLAAESERLGESPDPYLPRRRWGNPASGKDRAWEAWHAAALARVDAESAAEPAAQADGEVGAGAGVGAGFGAGIGAEAGGDEPPLEFKSLDPVNRVNQAAAADLAAAPAPALQARDAAACSDPGHAGATRGAWRRTEAMTSKLTLARAACAAFPLAALSLVVTPLAAEAAPVKFGATLSGANEVGPNGPGAGDPDGAGTFAVEIDADAGDFCYTITSAKIAAPTMAHVHTGAAGVNGGLVVTISPKANDECVAVEPDVLRPIVAAPEGFYVNIHNAEYPGGAIRGQLVKK
jgi:hypothetical protein